ncbi:efflux RND transporter permease subunit [Candidatus Thalassolituus haligoni]|uniref:efflux RND transporter permease subunit n=1 Tax=Candidatus Thalassolituus haligoni TaxID=3100113 RepID=UPI0035170CB9|tara:strand:+ start:14835 stop:17888 length:3054 start_codon:yes stop_codon:yes gene_type:complete
MAFPNLSRIAVRESSVTLFFITLSLVAGLYAFTSLGRAEDPDFTVRVMMVTVLWPGAAADELQDSVVDRLEKRIQEVEDLYKIETTVRAGRADLQVEFQDYTDAKHVPDRFYQVRRRMQDEASQLPDGVIGPIVNEDFGDVYFTLVALTASGVAQRELIRDAEAIRDRVQRVQGVEKAEILGERSEQVFVDFDMTKLQGLGVSLTDIIEAIQANNRLLPAGHISTAGPKVYLRLDDDLSNLEALQEVPVRIDEHLIRLGDIATISRGYEDPPSYLIRSSGEDALLIGVVMRRGENGLAFGKRLRAFWENERVMLPLGMELDLLTNQEEAIIGAVNLFQVKFLVAVLVVMAVTMLAVGLRAGIVVGIAIPVTLGLSFIVMLAMGINLDRITLGALIIALGLLVDDAIIAIEMMIVKLEEGWDKLLAASHAWNVTAAPMLYGTLVTVAGFVPIGFARSSVGEYAGNIFWVLAIALLLSWVVAVVFTPYLGVKILPDNLYHSSHSNKEAYSSRPYRMLRKLIIGTLAHRKIVVLSTFALLFISIVGMIGPVQKQFFPVSDRLEVLVSIYHPQGTSIEATDATVQKIERLMEGTSGIKSMSAYIGAGAPRFFISASPEQPNSAFAKLVIVAEDIAARDGLIRLIRNRVAAGDFPESRVRAETLLYGPPVDWPVSIRVMGPEANQLRTIGKKVRDIIASHANTENSHLEWDERTPGIDIRFDKDRLRLFGLTPEEVAYQLQFQLSGLAITTLRDGIRLTPVVGRAKAEDITQIQNLEIVSEEGRRISFNQVGEADVVYEEPVIRRYNREPFVAVNADVRGAQAKDVTADVWAALAELRAQMPVGYSLQIGGSVEQSSKGEHSIQVLQPLMIVLMLVFVMLQMRSFKGTLVVILTAPLGLIGAVAALLIFNQPFGFVATLGIIGLAGILMRNTLILTQQISDNMKEGMLIRSAVIEAGVQRSRPVILTALAAVLAFVPLTIDSFWGPLAYVLIGGVSLGTVATLVFVPALYAIFYRIPDSDYS